MRPGRGRGQFSNEEYDKWDEAVCGAVHKAGFHPSAYCLRDKVKPKYHQPYLPEKEGDEQSGKNAIRIVVEDEPTPIEITELCPRLQPLTREGLGHIRHYVPIEARAAVLDLRSKWKVK